MNTSYEAKLPGGAADGITGDPYHVGIVVEDIDAGMEEFGRLFGVAWTGRLEATVHTERPDVSGPLDFIGAFSLDGSGPFRLELVQAIQGTLWEAGRGLHHVGFWSEDVPGDRDRLVAGGCQVAASLHSQAGARPFITLHEAPQGMYIEVVSVALRPQLEAAWAAGGAAG